MSDSFATPWTAAHQAPLSIGFTRQETGVDCHFFLQGIFLTQGSNLPLLYWQSDSLALSHQGSPNNEHQQFFFFIFILIIFVWFSHWVFWKPNEVTASKHLLSCCYVPRIIMGAEYKCEVLQRTYTGRHWFDKIKLYNSKADIKYNSIALQQ